MNKKTSIHIDNQNEYGKDKRARVWCKFNSLNWDETMSRVFGAKKIHINSKGK